MPEKPVGTAETRQQLVDQMMLLNFDAAAENTRNSLNQVLQGVLWPLREVLAPEQLEVIGRRFAEKMQPKISAAQRAALLSDQLTDEQLRILHAFSREHPWLFSVTQLLQRAVEESCGREVAPVLDETFAELGIALPGPRKEGDQ